MKGGTSLGAISIKNYVIEQLKPELERLLGFTVSVYYFRRPFGGSYQHWIEVSEEPYNPSREFVEELLRIDSNAELSNAFQRLLTSDKQAELRSILGLVKQNIILQEQRIIEYQNEMERREISNSIAAYGSARRQRKSRRNSRRKSQRKSQRKSH